MHKLKIHRNLKGYITIYILFLGLLCLTMVTLGFQLEIERNKNLSYIQTSILANDKSLQYREGLMSLFYKYLQDSKVAITEDSIQDFLRLNYSTLTLAQEEGRLYMKSFDVVIIEYPFSEYYKVVECYKYMVSNGGMNFNKVQSVVILKSSVF